MTFVNAMRLSVLRLLAVSAATVIAAIAIPATAFAKDPIYTGTFSNQAVSGYDVVAYFTDGAPREGVDEFATEYMGARWLFASQENLDRFVADPEAYAPQYGGYCAYAVSQGNTASGDPEQWSIVDGKLYLNYSARVKRRWEQDIPGYIEAADANWPTVLE